MCRSVTIYRTLIGGRAAARLEPILPSVANFTKRIVCLANSKKLGGRCVAGIELEDGLPTDWIRPVSTLAGGEVPPHLQLTSGELLQLLDIIEVGFVKHYPNGCHVENWLYDTSKPWKKVGTFNAADLPKLLDFPPDLWGTGSGWCNSTVPYPESEQLNSSLLLVEALNPKMSVRKWPQGDTSVSVEFIYGSEEYSLKLTDPDQKCSFIQKGEGTHALGNSVYVCVSLAEPYNHVRTKLAAAVFTAQGPA